MRTHLGPHVLSLRLAARLCPSVAVLAAILATSPLDTAIGQDAAATASTAQATGSVSAAAAAQSTQEKPASAEVSTKDGKEASASSVSESGTSVKATSEQTDSAAKQEDAAAKEATAASPKEPIEIEAELPPEPKATQVPENDSDYNLLGEFKGSVEVDGESSELGIQIRPIGNGLFEAVQYAGGLPGDGADTEQSVELIGKRFGDSVVLSGGPWVIYAGADACTVLNATGPVGKLERQMRSSPTMGSAPPEGATILFDGTNTDQFTVARMTSDGLLAEGADVLPMFQDFNMHVEFRLPYMPDSDGQKRGNSGCYLQSRYEVQVLDSFATLPVFNGCSALYRFKQPDLNMCLPPLQWQTYDIRFTAARWGADGTKLRNARITVWHNGIKTQDDVELPNKTGAGKQEEPTLLPIRFQNHSDPVRFRNIWIVDRGLLDMPEFPMPIAQQIETEEAAAE
ncbi:MAG TPA: hypothetical protein DDW52_14525 [Planctomycetaceae bacterium]|nr:hypothetical protein [Planctomycetaceae bacterium]